MLGYGSRLGRAVACASATQTEEAGAVPRRAGDGAGDGGEARIGLLVPGKAARHDRDLVQNALVLAHHRGADLETPDRLGATPGQPVEKLARRVSHVADPRLLRRARRDAVDRTAVLRPLPSDRIAALAQAGQGGTRRMRQPARRQGQLGDAGASIPIEQRDHVGELAARPRRSRPRSWRWRLFLRRWYLRVVP